MAGSKPTGSSEAALSPLAASGKGSRAHGGGPGESGPARGDGLWQPPGKAPRGASRRGQWPVVTSQKESRDLSPTTPKEGNSAQTQ